VLRLLVEGRSNAEIAALFVGVSTAHAHVASILAKRGVPTRAAAAAYAVRHGLV
jgi:DNA-binding NarL/FixJ family response regulator